MPHIRESGLYPKGNEPLKALRKAGAITVCFKNPLLPWFSTKADPKRRTCDGLFIFKRSEEPEWDPWENEARNQEKKNIKI